MSLVWQFSGKIPCEKISTALNGNERDSFVSQIKVKGILKEHKITFSVHIVITKANSCNPVN